MRVFVLTTGRSGSTTFARACSHITNYTSGHETRIGQINNRLTYPDNHIEVDNRLAWFLGSLGRLYPDALYVHLLRDPELVIESYANRRVARGGIVNAFGAGIVRDHQSVTTLPGRRRVAGLMVQTINDNITEFLSNRRYTNIVMSMDAGDFDWHQGFVRMCNFINASGDRAAALRTLDTVHNARRRR